MALVSPGGTLVGFINKSDLVRDTDGCWPKAPAYSNLTSHKKGKCLGISLCIHHLSFRGSPFSQSLCQTALH